MDMETLVLEKLDIRFGGRDFHSLDFQKAELVLVTQYGDRLWYIDVDGISDAGLLEWFSHSDDIKVELLAVVKSGEVWEGTGYLHPNEPNRAAAIRGEGELKKTQ